MKKLLFLFLFSFSTFASEEISIHVWNSAFDGGEHYGHVSLQTPRSYISLWPSDINRIDLPIGCAAAQAIFNASYEKDYKDEKREADATYRLTLPSTQAIDNEWARLRPQNLTWFAFGKNSAESLNPIVESLALDSEARRRFSDLLDNPLAFNCASIVNHLLNQTDLNISNFLFIGSKHHPLTQAAFIGLYTRGRIDIVSVSKILENFMYPDKVGYMIKRKMVDQVTRMSGVPLDRFDYYLGEKEIDELYRIAFAGRDASVYERIRQRTLQIKNEVDSKAWCSIS